MRLTTTLLACLIVTPAMAADITVTATAVPLDPADPAQTAVDSLDYVAGFALDSTAPEWGGYSGMVLAADGSTLLAVSDVGHWLKLNLKHDADGKLIGVGAARLEPLLDEAGKPVTSKEWSDAEAITRTADGSFVVAFERHHRLWRYASVDGVPSGPATAVAAPDEIGSLPENGGIEALTAIGSDGFVLIAESADAGQPSRLWVRAKERGDTWMAGTVERSDGFEPTDLSDQLDAYSLLLERKYSEGEGPAARISIISPIETSEPKFGAQHLAVLRLPLTVDNFEALGQRTTANGETLIYVMSDDNQSDKQRTLLLQFRMRPQ
jgi:hypothetical protein